MGRLLYSFSILLAVGSAIVIELCLVGKWIKKHLKALCWLVLLYFIGSLSDALAGKWQVWEYGKTQSLHHRFLGVEVETYFFFIGIGLAVSIATLVWAEAVDSNKPFLPTLKRKTTKRST